MYKILYNINNVSERPLQMRYATNNKLSIHNGQRRLYFIGMKTKKMYIYYHIIYRGKFIMIKMFLCNCACNIIMHVIWIYLSIFHIYILYYL